MRFFITKKTLVWVIVLLCALWILASLAGCERGSLPVEPKKGVSGGPGAILVQLSLAATYAAGTCLIACAFLAIFYANKYLVAKLAVACVAIIIGAQIVYQFGHHLGTAALVTVVLGALCLGWWAWAHLGKIERRLKTDFNRDGKIG